MMKKATDEANREIESYKKQRNAQFEDYKKEVRENMAFHSNCALVRFFFLRQLQRMAGTEEFKAQLNKQTDQEIATLGQAAVSQRGAVSKLLLDIVSNVDIALPNAKK